MAAGDGDDIETQLYREPGQTEGSETTSRKVTATVGETQQAGQGEKTQPTTNLVVIGSIGDGKSTLIKALVDEEYMAKTGQEIECKMAGAGVTKECRAYPMKDTNMRIQLIDTPGVGDHDAKLSDVVPQIEAYFKNEAIGVDGVLLCCSVGQGRVTLGVQIASAILKMAVFDHNPEARKHLIVVGTKADRLDEEDREEWMEQVGPIFENKVGGPPGYIVLTKCKKTAKGRGKDDVASLLEAIDEIRKESFKMAYTEVDAEKMMNIVAESTGLDCSSGEMQQMIEELKQNRKLMEANQEQMLEQYKQMEAQVLRFEEEKKKAAAEAEESAKQMRVLNQAFVEMQKEQLKAAQESARKQEEANRERQRLEREYQKRLDDERKRQQERDKEAKKNEATRLKNEKEEREERKRAETLRQQEMQRLMEQIQHQNNIQEELREAERTRTAEMHKKEKEIQNQKNKYNIAESKRKEAESKQASAFMNVVDAIPFVGTVTSLRKLFW